MIEIKVYDDIANKKEGIWMSMFGIEDTVFSADMVKNVFARNKNEKEFKFDIHCNGGSTDEGFAIYDIIRNSGKTIYTNIDGGCHSMAITLLLAAPFENRTANRNSRALIHQVYAQPGMINVDQARDIADELEEEQSLILDIYEDRTGTDRKVLENLMKEEKMRTAQELLDYGFISKINNYNTNKKINKMSKTGKKPTLSQRVNSWLGRAKNLIDGLNFDFTDADGTVLFSTDGDDDTLEVGMAASPDGEFTLSDGTIVTIADGVITDVTVEDSGEEDVIEENKNLRKELANARELISELSNQVQSNYNAVGRKSNVGRSNGRSTPSKDDLKNEVSTKRNKGRGGK